MIKVLVSMELDLAASRAIRFACQLGYFIQMEIQPVYIKATPPRELSIGSGWARHHWEQEIVAQGRAEISELLSAEIDFCPGLLNPRIIYGDRQTELAKVLEKESFDLYVEGAPFPWTPAMLHQKIGSRVFQRAPGPIALAPVLRKIYQLLALCLEPVGIQALARTLTRIWSGCSVPVSLALPAGQEAALRPAAVQAQGDLAAVDCRVSLQEGFPFYPQPPGDDYLRQYGLAALALRKDLGKDAPVLQWLSQVRIPLLLVLY